MPARFTALFTKAPIVRPVTPRKIAPLALALGALFVAWAVLASPAEADHLEPVIVDNNGPDTCNDVTALTDPSIPFCTIQPAINHASAGKTVLVRQGTYTEPGIVIDKSLTLQGELGSPAIIQAATTSGSLNVGRVLSVNAPAGDVTIKYLTIRHGDLTGGYGGGIEHIAGDLTLEDMSISSNRADRGGGIHSAAGSLTLINTLVTNNQGTNFGGGIATGIGVILSVTGGETSHNLAGSSGGGIFTQGPTTLTDTLVNDNQSTVGGGGLTLEGYESTITRTTISNNDASLDGGGLWIGADNANATVVNLIDSTINANQGNSEGGGIYLKDTFSSADFATQLTLTNTDVTNNTAGQDGGGIANAGTGSPGYGNGAHVLIEAGSLIQGNTAAASGVTGSGGGIANLAGGVLTVDASTISQNGAHGGGGIYNLHAGSQTTITNSLISLNTAGVSGGGVSNANGAELTITNAQITDNYAPVGGGIRNASTVTVTGSLIDLNNANDGGGLFNDVAGMMTITDSDLVANGASRGGAIETTGTLNVHNSTLTENVALFGGAGIYQAGGAVIVDQGSLLTQNEVDPALGTGGAAIWNDSPAGPAGSLTVTNSAIVDNVYLPGMGAVRVDGGNNQLTYVWWGDASGPGGSRGATGGAGETVEGPGSVFVSLTPWLRDVEVTASDTSPLIGHAVTVEAAVIDDFGGDRSYAPLVARFSHTTPTGGEDASFTSPPPTAVPAQHIFNATAAPDTVTATVLFRGVDVGLEGSVSIDAGTPPPVGGGDDDEDVLVTSLTDAGVTIPIDPACYEEAEVDEDGSATLSTSGDCLDVTVTAPEGSLPEGHTLVLGIPEHIDVLPGDEAHVGFVVQLLDEDGDVVTDALDGAVEIEVTVPAGVIAESGPVTLAYWDGEVWVDLVPVEVTEHSDGSVVLGAEVTHFTIFGAVDAKGMLVPEPAGSGVSLTKWTGGPASDLPPAETYWVVVDGVFYGYSQVAPEFVNDAFLGLFPGGVIPEGTIFIVVR